MTVEDEIVHWWKDENNESHRNILRIESEKPQVVNGFPRDGVITIRIINGSGAQAMKLSPDEALRLSSELMAISKELLNAKRVLWNQHEE
ncbi:MAG: hypothetical protein QXP42_05405 [Candidatus Micrarchaeia archaeon]